MPTDDQTLLDTLSSVPRNAKQYTDDVADYIEKQFDMAAQMTRKILSSDWIPEPARRRPAPQPKPTFSPVPQSVFSRTQHWLYRHRILTAVVVVVLGGVIYTVIKKHKPRKRRRARRAAVTNARVEVVVLAASPAEPITRSIALDLERRGFIVYIVCNSADEESYVQNESRHDIKPLTIDTTDPESARLKLEKFAHYLQSEKRPFHGARVHYQQLRSLIIIPSLTYPASPIATLPPGVFSDMLNTKLFQPILTLQAFLPLLTSSALSANAEAMLDSPSPPSVLVLTPSIIPSLNLAFHSPESIVVSALNSFTSVLHNELAPLKIPVSQLQLGTFDFSNFLKNRPHSQMPQEQDIETETWESNARLAYEKNFLTLNLGIGNARGCGSDGKWNKGSALRVLHDRVFDVMTSGKGSIVRVGVGSTIYSLIGSYFPQSLISWMLGVRSSKPHQDAGRRKSGRDSLLLTPSLNEAGYDAELHGARVPSLSFAEKDEDDKDYLSVSGALRDLEGEDAWRQESNMATMSDLEKGTAPWHLADSRYK